MVINKNNIVVPLPCYEGIFYNSETNDYRKYYLSLSEVMDFKNNKLLRHKFFYICIEVIYRYYADEIGEYKIIEFPIGNNIKTKKFIFDCLGQIKEKYLKIVHEPNLGPHVVFYGYYKLF